MISNCVVNLSPDKEAVLRETFRVLKAGGRIGISDVVAEDRLTPEERAERGGWAGCIAGALSVGEYRRFLDEAGFGDVDIRFTHEVADGLHGAIVQRREAGRRAERHPGVAGGRRGRLLLSRAHGIPEGCGRKPPDDQRVVGGQDGPVLRR